MSKEETHEVVEETTTQEAPVETNEEAVEESNDVDYAAELGRVKEHNRVNAQKRLQKKEVESEEAPAEDLRSIIREELGVMRAQVAEEEAKSTLEGELAKISNENERELVKYHYENTIKRSGATSQAILSDIQNARALANYKRFQTEANELELAKKNRAGMMSDSAGSSVPVATEDTIPEWFVDRLKKFKSIPQERYRAAWDKHKTENGM